AERAGDADARQLSRAAHRPLDADDGVELKQRDRDGRVVKIDLAGAQRIDDRGRQGVDVDLEPDGQRRGGVDGGNDLVHAEHVGPELFVTERIEAEDGLATELSVNGGHEARAGKTEGEHEDQ